MDTLKEHNLYVQMMRQLLFTTNYNEVDGEEHYINQVLDRITQQVNYFMANQWL